MSAKRSEDDDRLVEEIYDALDDGRPEEALASARIALHDAPEDPVLHFLAGIALHELDQPEAAIAALDRAIALDPDDPEFLAARAQACYASCRFAEASADALRALAADAAHADALHTLGLVLERDGRFEEADAKLGDAARLDPDRFQAPVRIDREAFARTVNRAGEILPDDLRGRLDEVPVVVLDLPPEAILTDETPPLDPELLGLFVGTALPERSFAAGGVETPPQILLFKRNLERFARDEAELTEEIARTLHHELAHYLGFAEEDMVDLDLD
jgi:predicted Zn-dependent protease with MMP-like domain/cytochrome c-type biogenesis protein CcmH/NrfG